MGKHEEAGGPALGEPAIGHSIIRGIASRAYIRSGCSVGSDPRRLGLGLQLEPCPHSCEAAHVAGRTLYYPDHLGRREVGLSIFGAIARFLLAINTLPRSTPVIEYLIDELVLPVQLARDIPYRDLSGVQPFAPIALLERIYMSQHGSGTMSRSSA